MGVLVNYTISNLTVDEIRILGEAVDLLPHGKVQALVAKIQVQISEQERAESERAAAAVEAWRAAERDKIKAELADSKSEEGI